MKLRLWAAGLRALPFLAFLGVVWYACLRWLDADFWWHYRAGEYVLGHGVPARDIFTYTAADYPWVNHEWLSDVVLVLLGMAGGYGLIALVMAGIWTAAYGLAMQWRTPWWLTGVSLAALVPYLGVRSIVWSMLGFALVLRLVERPRRWWILPVLFGLWANLHGGFALGLVAVGLYMVVKRAWRLGVWLAMAAVATLANPYGVRVYGEIWQTMTDSKLHSLIVEWWPLGLTLSNVVLVAAAVVVLVSVRFDLWRRVLGGLVLLASVSANRQLPFVVLAMGEPLRDIYERSLARVRRVRPGLARLITAGATTAGLGLVPLVMFWPQASTTANVVRMPVEAAMALRQEPCRGKVFNDYSFGGYLIGQVPGIRVYIDGRMPSWSGPEGRYLDRFDAVLKDPEVAKREFARYDVQCAVILKSNEKLMEHLERSGWRQAVTEPDAVLWRRD